MGSINVKSAVVLQEEFLASTKSRLTSAIQSMLDELPVFTWPEAV